MRNDEREDIQSEAGNASFGFHDLSSLVRRRVKLLASVIAIVITATIGVLLAQPNLYEATALIQLKPHGNNPVAIDHEVERVASKAILAPTVDLLDLRDAPEFSGSSELQRLQAWIGLSRTAPRRDTIVRALASRLKVFNVRNSLLIKVTARSVDPVKAARIANTIAEVYVRDRLEANERASARARRAIEARVAKLRRQLSAAGTQLKRSNPSKDVSGTADHLPPDRHLARDVAALIHARDATAAARARYEHARRLILEGAQAPVANILQNAAVRRLRDALTKALQRRTALQMRYGPQHPETEKSATDVARAQDALTLEINKIISRLHAAYRAAAGRQQKLEAKFAALERKISGDNAGKTTGRAIPREADAVRQFHEALLAQMKQSVETTGRQFADVRIVRSVGIAASPSTPSRMTFALFGVLGVMGASAMAFGVAFVVAFAQPRFARDADAERSFDLPQIAAFPSFDSNEDGDGGMNIVRLMTAGPDSTFAESTRALRHEIDARRDADGARVVMLTSAMAGEGTTLIASNLAHDLAMTGSKTLLVDGDLQRAQLSETLGLSGRNGLFDVLAGRATPLSAILTEQTSGVHVLPATSSESPDTSAAQLLSSRAFAAALEVYRQQFDTIVIDTPPILPVTDARLIAAQADQIALVTTWHKTPREFAKRALKLLGSNRNKIIGVVTNRVDPAEFEMQSCFDARENHHLTRKTENAA